MTKQEQRAAGKAARKKLSPQEQKTANRALCEAVTTDCEAFRRARVVLLYHAVGSEADVGALVQYVPDKTYAFPYCPAKGEMEAYAPASPDEWSTDEYGIPAPDPARARRIAPAEIDLVLVPGTAFDHCGGRIGMGAGVYDRYLQQCPQAFRLGVAYAAQMVEQVAAEPWDVRMDAVVTEQGMCPCESGSGQKRKDEEQPE